MPAVAQTIIPIQTKQTSLILQVLPNKHLNIEYLGSRLSNEKEYSTINSVRFLNEEGATNNSAAYPGAGTNIMFEPAIACVHADGNNSLDLQYVSHSSTLETEGSSLTSIMLKDPLYDFYVDLYYRAWPNEDVIEQWAVIRNQEKGKVVLNKYASASLYFYNKDFVLTSYNGGWAREMQPVETHLQQGIHSISSKLGTRENLLGSQNFMLSLDGRATEDNGTVLLGQLAWNGNYNIEF